IRTGSTSRPVRLQAPLGDDMAPLDPTLLERDTSGFDTSQRRPVEATALGNVLVQARAAGVVGTDLDDLRRLVRQFAQPRPYRPTSGRL
ncbi:MAG: hypothetical protein M3R66_02435, partial [Actinomycetota bacterium]|nr:hypothetical protein [Actinomycetota bacterium]